MPFTGIKKQYDLPVWYHLNYFGGTLIGVLYFHGPSEIIIFGGCRFFIGIMYVSSMIFMISYGNKDVIFGW